MKFPRRALVPLLLCAIAALFIPAPVKGMTTAKPNCCAHMKMEQQADDSCPMHKQQTPAKEQESPCCQACALGFALLFVAPPNFVYAQTSEEALVSLDVGSSSLPHRPPVPPPRFAIA